MLDLPMRQCDHCGEEFKPHSRAKRFCCVKCQVGNWGKLHPDQRPYTEARKARKRAYRQRPEVKLHERAYNNAWKAINHPPTARSPIACDRCGSTFVPKTKRSYYCSKPCGIALYAAKAKAKPTARICIECGTEFMALRKRFCSDQCRWKENSRRRQFEPAFVKRRHEIHYPKEKAHRAWERDAYRAVRAVLGPHEPVANVEPGNNHEHRLRYLARVKAAGDLMRSIEEDEK